MAKKSVEIELDIKDRNAQRRLKELSKETQNLSDDFEDVESAGDAMARALTQAAEETITEIDNTKRAVDALDKAFDDADFDAAETVAELKRAGLSAEDVEQSADELATALKAVDDVKMHAVEAGFKDVDQAMGNTQDATGKTRDSMTGFVGGTVGELPLISDAMGPIAEGLGQMTEGFLEGEVNVKQFIGAGLGMAGVGIAVGAAASAWESYKERQEEIEQATEDASERMLEQLGLLEGFQDLLDGIVETEGFSLAETLLGDMEPEDVAKLNAALADLDLTWDDLTAALEASDNGTITALADEMLAASGVLDQYGLSARAVSEAITDTDNYLDFIEAIAGYDVELREALRQDDAFQALYENIEGIEDTFDDIDVEKAMADVINAIKVDPRYADEWKRLREAFPGDSELDSLRKLEAANEDVAEAVEESLSATDAAAAAREAHVVAIEAEKEALMASADAMRAGADAKFASTQATDDFNIALWEGTEALNETIDGQAVVTEGSAEYNDILIDTTNSAADMADAEVRVAQEAATAAGAVLSQSDATSIWNGNMIAAARQASGPLKQSIIDYIAEVNGIPPEVVSDILADTDYETVEEANAALDEVSEARSAQVTAEADTVQARLALNAFVNERRTARIVGEIYTPRASSGVNYYDRGGFIPNGQPGVVAERRPEYYRGQLLTSPTVVTGPGRVTSGQATAAMQGQAAPAQVINVTQNFPRGTRPEDVAKAQRRYDRRNGGA